MLVSGAGRILTSGCTPADVEWMEKAGMDYCQLQPNVTNSSLLSSSSLTSRSISKFVKRL